jgi:hypothetical protein
MRYGLSVLLVLAAHALCYSQRTDTLATLQKQFGSLDQAVQARSTKMLDQLQKQELGMQQQLQKTDSNKARQFFANSAATYEKLRAKLASPTSALPVSSLNCYVSRLDSLNSALIFLKGSKAQALSGQLQQLQGSLQKSYDIQEFAKAREQQLKAGLASSGLAKKLLGMNKSVYYYQQQMEQYKSMLNDRQKMQEAVLGAVAQSPLFQHFLQKHSWLSQLFPMPASGPNAQAAAGARNLSAVQLELKQHFGQSGGDPMQYIQKQVGASQSQQDGLQDKVQQLGILGSPSSVAMPDFTPNSQKTKSLLKRLEFGINLQTQTAGYLLPVTSEFALTMGYKLTDKITLGIGSSYNLGWGYSINHLQLSNQGLSMRSFADIKAKGSIWITGGFEYTYLNQFAEPGDLYHFAAWQKSALLGLTKKYKIGNRSGNVQLLFDMLYASHAPQTQPLIFRTGYTL